MAGPITPKQAASGGHIPEAVYDAFNELIAEGAGRVLQKDVVERILSKMPELEGDSSTIFRKGWLDVEGAYRAKGWKVDYDKPGYNETYEAVFTFLKKRKSGKK